MVGGRMLVLDLLPVDHLLDRIEPMKVEKFRKHLPARMRSALASHVYYREGLFEQPILHNPFGEKGIGVVIEVHLPVLHHKPRSCRSLVPREAEPWRSM